MLVAERLKKVVIDVPDFPKPGIVFKDLTPAMLDVGLMSELCSEWAASAARHDVVAGVEARGFIFGAWLAGYVGVPFVPVRKKGKLPRATVSAGYALEYGFDAVEAHPEALKGRRVLVLDDVLATGGTAEATSRVVAESGGTVVGFAFVLEIAFLAGRKKLEAIAPIHSILVT